MRCIEFGKENSRTVLLLHGGGLSWWNYRAAANLLKDSFHVVLPLLPGHAGSGRPFTGIGDAAKELIRYIDETFGGQVYIAGGLSLGAQILTEALSLRNDLCRFLLIESAAVIPDPVTKAIIRPVFGMSYGLIRQRWFAKLQFRYLKIPPELFEDYYRDTCAIQKENMIRFLEASSSYSAGPGLRKAQAEACIAVGQKEGRRMQRSAEALRSLLPRAELAVLPGLAHGELSMCHPDHYVHILRQLAK